MIRLHILLAVVLLAPRQSIPAEAFVPTEASEFDQVHPRNTGHPSFAPLIFHNLTKAEFIAKREEVRRVHLVKREPVGEESANGWFEQAVLEERNLLCIRDFGPQYRISSGNCFNNFPPRQMTVRCRKLHQFRGPNEHSTPSEIIYEFCATHQVCATILATNFYGIESEMPLCEDRFLINSTVSDNFAAIAEYEGSQHVPHPATPPHSPSILDSIDQIWEVEDGSIPGLTAQWDYRGSYSNGNGFSSRSFGMTHSWSCIGCPACYLYATTVGFKALAVGTVFMLLSTPPYQGPPQSEGSGRRIWSWTVGRLSGGGILGMGALTLALWFV